MDPLEVNKKNLPIGVIVTFEYVKRNSIPLTIVFGVRNSINVRDNMSLKSLTSISRFLARLGNLNGSTILEQTEVEYWINFAYADTLQIHQLEEHLTKGTYLVGQTLTAADLAVWGSLYGKDILEEFVSVNTWYSSIESLPVVMRATQSLPVDGIIFQSRPHIKKAYAALDYLRYKLKLLELKKTTELIEADVKSAEKQRKDVHAEFSKVLVRKSAFAEVDTSIENLYKKLEANKVIPTPAVPMAACCSLEAQVIDWAENKFRVVEQPALEITDSGTRMDSSRPVPVMEPSDEKEQVIQFLKLLDKNIKINCDKIIDLIAKNADKIEIDETAKAISDLKKRYESHAGFGWMGLKAKKERNFAEWYLAVITQAGLIGYSNANHTSGLYAPLTLSLEIWKFIRNFFQEEITKMKVEDFHYPINITVKVIEKEKTHLADFGEDYPEMIRAHVRSNGFPFKSNRWSSDVDFESKNPLPLVGSREFLWQEGHTAFKTANESKEDVYHVLELYSRIYKELLAIPVIEGHKTKKRMFAGGGFSATVEAFIATTGRAIRGAASHHLGQNCSKMLELLVEDPKTKEKHYVFQNSWSITSRAIDVMVMTHSDNKGLVLPPKVAPVQVVIVPHQVRKTDKANTDLNRQIQLRDACTDYRNALIHAGIRVECDARELSAECKLAEWELKGVPILMEIATPRDVTAKEYCSIRRDTGERRMRSKATVAEDLTQMLEDIQQSLLSKATQELDDYTVQIEEFKDFIPLLESKNVILAPFCGEVSCEENIEKATCTGEPGARSICIPFEQPLAWYTNRGVAKCIHPECERDMKYYCLFGRTY